MSNNKPSAAAIRAAERITPSSNPARQKAVLVAAADIDHECHHAEVLEAMKLARTALRNAVPGEPEYLNRGIELLEGERHDDKT